MAEHSTIHHQLSGKSERFLGRSTTTFTPVDFHQRTQRNIAYWTLGVYAGLLTIVTFTWVFKYQSLDDTIKMLTTVSAIVSGMAGAIIGFYFQQKKD